MKVNLFYKGSKSKNIFFFLLWGVGVERKGGGELSK